MVLTGILLFGILRRGEQSRPDQANSSPKPGLGETVDPELADEGSLRLRPSHLPLPDEVVLPPLADIVSQHGSPELTAIEDLEILSQALQFQMRVTGELPKTTASNLEITAWLAGLNTPRIAVVSPDHESIDEDGLLVDRWRTPYRFALLAESASRQTVRVESAGPDAEWGGPDDLAIEMDLGI